MRLIIIILALSFLPIMAQEQKELEKALRLSEKYTQQANEAFIDKKPVQAEVDYRYAISENKNNNTAQYNLGNAYYQQKSYGEALLRYKNASSTEGATTAEKHRAMHNLGNVMMKNKAYDKAVEAYKEALRNDPTDEETRYNLALAQELLKKNPPENNGQNNNDNQDKNQDEQNKDQNKENQDKDQNKDDQNKEQNKENQDKDQNKGDDNKDQNKDKGDNKDDQDKEQGNDQKDDKTDGKDPNKNSEGGNEKRPSELSPKQIERILEAMNNEERKVQEKINAQKVQGKPVRSDKDW